MSLTLLLDSDIFAYKAASRNQVVSAFGTYTYEDEARAEVDAVVAELMERFGATDVIMCLTDEANFRYAILPTYKHNRDRTKRPELLKPMKEYLATEYRSYIRPGLEADDIMGILATHPTLVPGDKIIVSDDKDMRTVPAKVFHPRLDKQGVMHISKRDAHAFHMWQTICGDPTDGYSGVKGLGKSSTFAEDIIGLEPEEMWDEVLTAYAMKGLKEDDALVQARVAKILTADLYDFKKKEPILWTPIHLLY